MVDTGFIYVGMGTKYSMHACCSVDDVLKQHIAQYTRVAFTRIRATTHELQAYNSPRGINTSLCAKSCRGGAMYREFHVSSQITSTCSCSMSVSCSVYARSCPPCVGD